MTLLRSPKWAKWQIIPEVRVWEAVALSLDIDPGLVRISSSSWMVGTHIFEEKEVFADRIEMIARTVDRTGGLRVVSKSGSEAQDYQILLGEVANWAASVGWQIPAELQRVGIAYSERVSSEIPGWQRRDIWTVRETAFLLCGRLPDSGATSDEDLKAAVDAIFRAIAAGALNIVGDHNAADTLYNAQKLRPAAVVAWAAGRFARFPFRPVPTDAAAPALMFELRLPTTVHAVTVGEIPSMTAAAIWPENTRAADLPNITSFQKQVRSRARPLELTKQDWKRLGKALEATGQLQVDLPTSDEAFARIQAACRQARIGWRLIAFRNDEALNQGIKRSAVTAEHEKRLGQAIASGEVQPLDPLTFLPLGQAADAAGKRAVLSSNQFSRFAATLGIRVVQIPAAEEPPLEESQERPLATRERTSLLWMVAALARMAQLEIEKPSKAANVVVAKVAELGGSISNRAVENHLKAAVKVTDLK